MDTYGYTDAQCSRTPHCAATTRDGSPCGAARLAGSHFCAFHDAGCQEAIAAGRARGGAAPRRRTRRLPRRLDYLQVADLLGELFVDVLNHANPADPRSLRAVCQVGRLLLHAVGRPKDSFVSPTDDGEPKADAPHLLRVYQPSALALEGLFAAEPAARPRPAFEAPPCDTAPRYGDYRDYYFQPGPTAAPYGEPPVAGLDPRADDVAEPLPPAPEERQEDTAAPFREPMGPSGVRPCPEGERSPILTGSQETPLPIQVAGPAGEPPDLTSPLADEPPLPQLLGEGPGLGAAPAPSVPHASPLPLPAPPEPRPGQHREQGINRELDSQWTGSLATERVVTADPAPVAPPAPAAGPGLVLPRSLVYIRRPPRDPFG